jgi:hypothetical protein
MRHMIVHRYILLYSDPFPATIDDFCSIRQVYFVNCRPPDLSEREIENLHARLQEVYYSDTSQQRSNHPFYSPSDICKNSLEGSNGVSAFRSRKVSTFRQAAAAYVPHGRTTARELTSGCWLLQQYEVTSGAKAMPMLQEGSSTTFKVGVGRTVASIP